MSGVVFSRDGADMEVCVDFSLQPSWHGLLGDKRPPEVIAAGLEEAGRQCRLASTKLQVSVQTLRKLVEARREEEAAAQEEAEEARANKEQVTSVPVLSQITYFKNDVLQWTAQS